MTILLTGGSGDVGTLLTRDLLARGENVRNLDLASPKIKGGEHQQGSITDFDTCLAACRNIRQAVHIAAWHGIHEGTKTPQDFHDLNVTGTFNMLEAAAQSGVQKFIFVSSTSVDDAYGVYGHTKILGEEMCHAYAARHGMNIIILRPRAFIPPWNKAVYQSFLDWAAWFMKGAVHILDFQQALRVAMDMPLETPRKIPPVFPIDGAYDYTPEDLAQWDAAGAGTSFQKRYPAYTELAATHGLPIARKPKVLEIPDAQKLPGYIPQYSLNSLLDELKTYGVAGPPAPF